MLDVKPKPERQKLLYQLLPRQGVRYKTQGLFLKEGKQMSASHMLLR